MTLEGIGGKSTLQAESSPRAWLAAMLRRSLGPEKDKGLSMRMTVGPRKEGQASLPDLTAPQAPATPPHPRKPAR